MAKGKKVYAPIINDDLYGFERVNVEAVLKDPSSLFHCIRVMINRRRKHLSFGHGSFQWVRASTIKLACFIRAHGIDRMLIVHNLSQECVSASVYLPSSEYRTYIPYDETSNSFYRSGKECDVETPKVTEVLTDMEYIVSGRGSLELTLDPYQFLWLNLGELGGMGDTAPKPVPSRRQSVVPPPKGMGSGLSGLRTPEITRIVKLMSSISEEEESDTIKMSTSPNE